MLILQKTPKTNPKNFPSLLVSSSTDIYLATALSDCQMSIAYVILELKEFSVKGPFNSFIHKKINVARTQCRESKYCQMHEIAEATLTFKPVLPSQVAETLISSKQISQSNNSIIIKTQILCTCTKLAMYIEI